ncbi:MAG: hypothetical protein ACQEQF_12495 [Bacillota bacterium]
MLREVDKKMSPPFTRRQTLFILNTPSLFYQNQKKKSIEPPLRGFYYDEG